MLKTFHDINQGDDWTEILKRHRELFNMGDTPHSTALAHGLATAILKYLETISTTPGYSVADKKEILQKGGSCT